MARLFILIKRKGSSRYAGAIPAKSGVSKTRLNKVVPKGLKKGYSYRIVTEAQLKRLIKSRIPKRRRKKVKRRRKVKRTRRRFKKKK